MSAPPTSITGGCLCASIRYEITFHKPNQWPPRVSTCQCTMCRKFTGSLIPQYIYVSPDRIVPALASSPTYREYGSSPGRHRGFCGTCASPLIWRTEEKPNEWTLFVGSIDEKWLVGERVEGEGDEEGRVKRRGGVGKELCTPTGEQFYDENVIPGITDVLPGGVKMPSHR